ncbi:MAG: F0F1 ATP synthase subunit epsilon [Gammaproteobacteria bacterium]|jgi:F-type H+-transporting ATPase subunit epsilon|nr:F0F1 ATP synthase subunit epsilon [Gammaproteobacteria bacterium]
MMRIRVQIVDPEAPLYSGEAEAVFAPAELGEVGIMPRHAPLLTRLRAGEVRVRHDAEEESFFVTGGILEVQPFAVTVLADRAVRSTELDEEEARRARQRAEERLAQKAAELDIAHAEAELAEAVARLRAIERLRKIGVLK